MELTTSLIPTNGVHITRNSFPAGFYVAKYDAEGMTEGNRYFPTREQAEAYARVLSAPL